MDYLKENLWVEWGSTNVDIPYHRLLPGGLPHDRRVIPFMNNYESLARFISNDGDGGIELIKRCWGNMLGEDTGSTFWEWAGRDGYIPGRRTSLCHGWSAGVVPLLSKFVLGVRPKGHERTYKCEPNLFELEWVEGRVPVEGGFIEARAEKTTSGKLRVKVEAPTGWRER